RPGLGYRLMGDGALDAFITEDSSTVVLHDPEKNRVVWQRPCRLCKDISVSEDGTRFVYVGADGLEVWDTRTGQRLFQETRRIRHLAVACAIARDGRRLAWGFVDKVIVRDLDSAGELAGSVDSALRGFSFSPDGRRLLIASARSTALWEAATGRAIWSVPSDVPEDVYVRWSSDARAILLGYGWAALEVLEATSGERLAWFETLGPPVTPVRASIW